MSKYIAFSPFKVKKAAVRCIGRIATVGESVLIDADNISLNEKCEIDFSIYVDDDYASFLYENNMTIVGHNLQLVITLLVKYNTKRIRYCENKNMYSNEVYDIDIFSPKYLKILYNRCMKITNINHIIDLVNEIPVISCNNRT